MRNNLATSLDSANTIRDALAGAVKRLMGSSGSPRLDAQLILAHALNVSREWLIAHDTDPISPFDARTFDKLIMLRASGMPTAYVLGTRPFFDRVFKVTSHVLIPRPETEHLVELGIAWGKDRGAIRVIDVGTGSGIIAVTLAAHLPHARIIATDVSAAALLIARENGADVPNLIYIQADLLSPFGVPIGAQRPPFDMICANLPYIASGELDVLEVAKFEPLVALDGGADGLVLFRRFLARAPHVLANPGLLLMEIGADQGEAVAQLARTAFPHADVRVVKDYGKLDRVVRVEQLE
jgi:release factor glutamine methyltransferase